ncbi:fungal-specific transcription factor domain-containing protein [Xylariales sp. PMI_506]|nr:fungal-specific transcription factor domain-containing protein [Xylariales sp. PMI_506]
MLLTHLVGYGRCWTCRARKVKCDERKPGGCGVCERVGVRCAGYGVNLSWDSDPKHLQGRRRRRIQLTESTSPVMTEREINRLLSNIDSTSVSTSTHVAGPFAVFKMEHTRPIVPSSDTLLSAPGPGDGDTAMSDPFSALQEGQEGVDAVETTNDCRPISPEWVLPEDSNDSADIVEVSRKRWSTDVDESADFSPLSLITSSVQEAELITKSAPEMVQPTSPHLELSLPLFRDHQTSVLMHHYVDHVAELLQPVHHPRNPWKTTYFPSALDGCSDLFLYQSNTAQPPQAAKALFHGILSAAAFHLRNATNGSTQFHKLGLRHRIKALRALNAAVIAPSNPQVHTVYLTAIMSLVTVDTITGEDTDFLIHLRACRAFQRDRRALTIGLGAANTNQVNTICRFLSLLAQSTSFKTDPKPWPLAEDLDAALDLPLFGSEERSMEYIYGVTPMLGNLLHKTCQISEYLDFYSWSGESIPSSLREACEVLGWEIIGWDIEADLFSADQPLEGVMLEVIRCQARAFYSALLVFYYRATEASAKRVTGITTAAANGAAGDNGDEIGASPHRGIDPAAEVRNIWQNLESAENLKDAVLGGAKRAAPMSWPAFIGACEAQDRQPWVDWWARVHEYRIGNFVRQWMVVQKVWAAMDADESAAGNWRDALRRTGLQVLPI